MRGPSCLAEPAHASDPCSALQAFSTLRERRSIEKNMHQQLPSSRLSPTSPESPDPFAPVRRFDRRRVADARLGQMRSQVRSGILRSTPAVAKSPVPVHASDRYVDLVTDPPAAAYGTSCRRAADMRGQGGDGPSAGRHVRRWAAVQLRLDGADLKLEGEPTPRGDDHARPARTEAVPDRPPDSEATVLVRRLLRGTSWACAPGASATRTVASVARATRADETPTGIAPLPPLPTESDFTAAAST